MVGGLRAACDEMGAVLVRSAHSANIKERRDCSTALFDAAGELVMQAEHIPVHLGSMPEAVRAVLRDGDYEASDVLEDDAGGEQRDVTLRVKAALRGERLTLDFTGSDPQVEGNLNCPLPVTLSASF